MTFSCFHIFFNQQSILISIVCIYFFFTSFYSSSFVFLFLFVPVVVVQVVVIVLLAFCIQDEGEASSLFSMDRQDIGGGEIDIGKRRQI